MTAVTADTHLRGIIFNIQRNSSSDGPGVRTTVFLKGCSNRCDWCHNPESIRPKPQLQVYLDRCIGCGRCVVACEHGGQHLDDGVRRFDREVCVGCGQCAAECFTGALEISGRSMSVDQVVAEVVKDEVYYRHSGGGVTFSGGDPVLQPDFLRELLIACGERGLHVAIDTAGNYPWKFLASLLPHVDLVMYDVKILDQELSRRYIGNDGTRSLQNLDHLAATGCPLIVRTPVIGGVNDTREEIGGIARHIGAFESLLYYELLPYHPLGDAKLSSLDLPASTQFTTPDADQLQTLAAIARHHVSEVRPHAPTVPTNGRVSGS
ncbi:MAG: glycyl-radical enzyme activating protein [Gemmatimonadetes bacterium]|jgi:glycyl-radical enzyme activating protein|nr:glycyl-radical enzyme activating protein [Gemmatimonadota bacterium]MBT4610624.1 glycyl-radical enzyme activating protein [Gemmatimonadota bacterium]MBT5057923.1 glycyl-radical enzyme activating protein [Gemmatimonadota bacterium]MBT5144363.1 glycyl-radical enzyme activating protein [Gemmatimonadota bacterium]MBT5587119.1 glycyl-radical enzyme activating protein [Gemmatimonadota bacterium]